MISFTNREAVVKLFALLSGFEKVQVKLYISEESFEEESEGSC